MKYKADIIAKLNQVRLFKRAYLPCELVGLVGDAQMKYCKSFEEPSLIVWKFQIPHASKPRGKVKTIWAQFLNWIKL